MFRKIIKGLKPQTAFIYYLQGLRPSKYDIGDSKEDLYDGVQLQHIWML